MARLNLYKQNPFSYLVSTAWTLPTWATVPWNPLLGRSPASRTVYKGESNQSASVPCHPGREKPDFCPSPFIPRMLSSGVNLVLGLVSGTDLFCWHGTVVTLFFWIVETTVCASMLSVPLTRQETLVILVVWQWVERSVCVLEFTLALLARRNGDFGLSETWQLTSLSTSYISIALNQSYGKVPVFIMAGTVLDGRLWAVKKTDTGSIAIRVSAIHFHISTFLLVSVSL